MAGPWTSMQTESGPDCGGFGSRERRQRGREVSGAQAITWNDRKGRTVSRSISWDDKKSRRTVGVVLIAFGALLGATSLSASLHPASHHVSVIVRALSGHESSAARAVESSGGTVTNRLSAVDSVLADVPQGSLTQLAGAPDVAEVTPDAPLHLLSTQFDPATDMGSLYSVATMDGAHAYWKAGYTGNGVDVALVDSGVAPVDGLSSDGKVVNGPDLSSESSVAALQSVDTFGHGTHVAGIIAGRDTAVTTVSAADTTHFLGIAPDARIVNLKVADALGRTDMSKVLTAIDWVVRHRDADGLNIRVLNLSFGTDPTQDYALDPLAYAAEQAWQHGIAVVVSAGNGGAQTTSLTDPAIDPYVIAVGAADTNGTANVGNDTAASFTSRGSDQRTPDLAAPGVHIASLRVPDSFIDHQYGSTGLVGTRFFRGTGTSQSAAIVSGAAALVISQRPTISPDELKALLTGSARSIHGATNLVGAGELDLARALKQPTPSASQSWPSSTGSGSAGASCQSSDQNGTSGNNETSDGSEGDAETPGSQRRDDGETDNESKHTPWRTASWSSGSWSVSSWSSGSWSSGSWSSGSWSSASWSSASWS
jgi:serine protease AprX